MTIEQALRRRATQSRCLGILWLSLTAVIVVGSFASLPHMVASAVSPISKLDETTSGTVAVPKDQSLESKGIFTNVQFLAIVTLVLGLGAVSVACYFLGRAGCIEIELAARFGGLADALCLAGNDIGQLERAAVILVPKSKYLSTPDLVSVKDLKVVADAIKPLR